MDLATLSIAKGNSGGNTGDSGQENKSIFYVNVTIHQNGSAWEFNADKTLDDLFDAYNDGKFLIAKVIEELDGAPEQYWDYFELPLVNVNPHMQTINGKRESIQTNSPTTGKVSFIQDSLVFNPWTPGFQRITIATCDMA